MLNVYILEDYKPYLSFLKQSLQNVLMIENLTDVRLIAESDPRILLDKVSKDNLSDSLFFLDIEIVNSEQDGVTVADWIRSQSAIAEIIFITSHSEAALRILTHRIAPLDLIAKSEKSDAIIARIHADLLTFQERQVNRELHSSNRFTYTLGGRVFSIAFADLEYIQTVAGSPGELEIHAHDEEATFTGNLNQIQKKFPTLFRCHKSVLINPDQVQSLDAEMRFVFFKSGAKAEVSFRKLAGIRKILLHK